MTWADISAEQTEVEVGTTLIRGGAFFVSGRMAQICSIAPALLTCCALN